MIYLKQFPRCARQFVKNFCIKSWQNNDTIYLKNFPRSAREFVENFFMKINYLVINHDKINDIFEKIPALRAQIIIDVIATNNILSIIVLWNWYVMFKIDSRTVDQDIQIFSQNVNIYRTKHPWWKCFLLFSFWDRRIK